MKKLCVIIAFVLMIFGTAQVFADNCNNDILIVDLDPERIINPDELILDYTPDILGSVEDGILLDDDQAIVGNDIINTEITYSTLFNMSAIQVNGLLTTAGSGKSFTRSSLTYGCLYITGTLNTTSPTAWMLKCGACYYDYNFGLYVSQVYSYFEKGVSTNSDFFPASSFNSNITYYGFIKNESNDGYIYGNLTFYNSESGTY